MVLPVANRFLVLYSRKTISFIFAFILFIVIFFIYFFFTLIFLPFSFSLQSGRFHIPLRILLFDFYPELIYFLHSLFDYYARVPLP